MDLAAPFLHEFTYQAMCQDLLPIRDGNRYVCVPPPFHRSPPTARSHSFRNEEGQLEENEAVLSDEDKVWVDVRHMHMKDALDKLIDAFKQFTNEHNANGCAASSYSTDGGDAAQDEPERPQGHARQPAGDEGVQGKGPCLGLTNT
jgi:syntaxin-binding protein 1